MHLLHLFCNHQSSILRYLPKDIGQTEYLAIFYCPRCHKYGNTLKDGKKTVIWSRKLGDITNYKYISNERGDNNGI